VLDNAIEIAQPNSMISTNAPNWKPEIDPFFWNWDCTIKAPKNTIGMKGSSMISYVRQLKVIHPCDFQSLVFEVSNSSNSSTNLVEVKK